MWMRKGEKEHCTKWNFLKKHEDIDEIHHKETKARSVPTGLADPKVFFFVAAIQRNQAEHKTPISVSQPPASSYPYANM